MTWITPKLFLFLYFIPTICLAGLGRPILKDEVPQQLCLLDYGTSESAYSELCTGIPVDEFTLVTAAHCVKEGWPKKIWCGAKAEIVEIDSVEIHPGFHDKTIIENTAYLVNDIAKIHLKSRVSAPPLPVITLAEALSAKRCAFFGFSKLSGTSRATLPKPHFGWEVSPKNLHSFSEYNIIRSPGLKSPGGLSEVGDSGGPLMCEIAGQWKLLGVASSRDFNYHSLFTPALDPSFKIQPESASTKTPSLMDESLERSRLDALILEKLSLGKRLMNIKSVSHLTRELETIKAGDPESYLKQKRKFQEVYLKAIETLVAQPNFIGRLKPYSEILHNGKTKSIGDLQYNYFRVEKVNSLTGKIRGELEVLGPSENFSCSGELLCRDEVLEEIETDISNLDIYSKNG